MTLTSIIFKVFRKFLSKHIAFSEKSRTFAPWNVARHYHREYKSFFANVPKAKRKEYGQFFTTVQTARFMSNLFDFDLTRDEMRILDPGAGTGILSATVIEKQSNEGYKGRVNLTCYETDPLVIECVTSVGQISAKRMLEINQMTTQVTCVLPENDANQSSRCWSDGYVCKNV